MVKERVRKEAWAVNTSKEECISDLTCQFNGVGGNQRNTTTALSTRTMRM